MLLEAGEESDSKAIDNGGKRCVSGASLARLECLRNTKRTCWLLCCLERRTNAENCFLAEKMTSITTGYEHKQQWEPTENWNGHEDNRTISYDTIMSLQKESEICTKVTALPE